MSTQAQKKTRYEKGEQIADALRIAKGVNGGYAYVQSQTKKGVWYKVTVNVDQPYCECPDNQVRGNVCKHILAVIIKETGGIKIDAKKDEPKRDFKLEYVG